jgi:hypothetical protein
MTTWSYRVGSTHREKAHGREHHYVCVGSEPYERRDGEWTRVLTWQGHCSVCGAPFNQKTGGRPKSMVRTCPAHRGRGASRRVAAE